MSDEKTKDAELVDIAELKKSIGRFLVLWRNETKQIGKIVEVTDDEVVYMMTSGPDRGKKFRAKYFGKTLKVFDEENLILSAAE